MNKDNIAITGDIKYSTTDFDIAINPSKGDNFLLELQQLMMKHKIVKLDVCFDIFKFLNENEND